jgi:hypothetical protein
MKKMLAAVSMVSAVALTVAPQVFANEPKGEGAPDYSGITGLYYVIIALILGYGVWDTFIKKS